jgi:hypothetical protein
MDIGIDRTRGRRPPPLLLTGHPSPRALSDSTAHEARHRKHDRNHRRGPATGYRKPAPKITR